MTRNELRKHEEYKKCIDKIKSYSKGFEFTIDFRKIPKAKANALDIVLGDCLKNGLLECTSIELSLDCERTTQTFKKL